MRKYAAAAMLLSSACLASPVFAVTLFVDDVAGSDVGNCAVAATPCQTIDYTVSQSTSGDVIELATSGAGGGNFAVANILIPHALTIRGTVAGLSRIDAGVSGERHFTVDGGNFVLDRVVLINGEADPLSNERGGSVLVETGNLVVTRSVVIDNEANAGGAFAALDTAGRITVTLSKVVNNHATGSGGAIHCDRCAGVIIGGSSVTDNVAGSQGGAVFTQEGGVATSFSYLSRNEADDGGAVFALEPLVVLISDSEIRDNLADAGDGGGIHATGPVSIQRSAIIGNEALDNGGGLYAFGTVDVATSNSTWSGNAAIAGGGMSLVQNFPFPGPTALIANSTFVDNESSFGGTGHHITGAWTFLDIDNSILYFANLLPGAIPACSAPASTGTNNLVDDASCDSGVGFNLGVPLGVDANPAYNGGFSRTHAIDAASNAVDAGDVASCLNTATGNLLTVDQRRRSRPVGICDIGAYELQ